MFKYVSGDFAQEYNKILEELDREQRELDEKFSEKISEWRNKASLRSP